MNEDELLYLLMHGRADDIRFIFKDIEERSYPEDFPTFIDAMIREHKIKRKNIAIRSGMSQDYTYKLLRGDKKTTERDYILRWRGFFRPLQRLFHQRRGREEDIQKPSDDSCFRYGPTGMKMVCGKWRGVEKDERIVIELLLTYYILRNCFAFNNTAVTGSAP